MEGPPGGGGDEATRRRSRASIARSDRTRRSEVVSSVGPELAVADFQRLQQLIDTDAADGVVTRTALVRLIDAADGEWRMRVYRTGAPIALADLLPVLTHVGLQALEEHPYRFEIEGRKCFLYDVGVRLPAGAKIDAQSHRELLVPSTDCWRGRSSPTVSTVWC